MIRFGKTQRIIVTGASSGIGESVSLLLNELGASVIGIGRNQKRLQAMKEKCKSPENTFIEIKDLAEDIEGLPAYVKSLKEKYGKFQGLVLSAGIADVKPAQLLSLDEMRALFDIDYFSPVFMAKGFVDRRINNGSGSAIVAISSIGAHSCDRGIITYGSAKAALSAAMKVLSREVVGAGVRINILTPTHIKTPMQNGAINNMENNYPLGYGEPGDVAAFVAYLLSDKAKWICSQDYIVDCGSSK